MGPGGDLRWGIGNGFPRTTGLLTVFRKAESHPLNPRHPTRRKPGGKTATNARRTCNFELCLVPAQRVLDDGQPESGTASIARTAAIDAVETLGQPGDMPGINADAGILDGKLGALRAGIPSDAHRTADWRVANGVGHQVAEGANQFRLRATQVTLAVAFDDDAAESASASRRSLSIRLTMSTGSSSGGGADSMEDRVSRSWTMDNILADCSDIMAR